MYSVPLAGAVIRFTIQISPYATFTQNSLQTIDVYTDAGGIATVIVMDTYAETVTVRVESITQVALPVTVNQIYASNTGVTTTILIANANNAPCNTICNLVASPYLLQDIVRIDIDGRLQVDSRMIVKCHSARSLCQTRSDCSDLSGRAVL